MSKAFVGCSHQLNLQELWSQKVGRCNGIQAL